MPDATYYKTTDLTGIETFHCLYCEQAGQEHRATDPALFASHMEQRHDGRLVEGRAPEPAPEPAPEMPDEDEEVPAPTDPTRPPVPTPDPEPVPDEPPPPVRVS
jgi:outer membrane biosynthesis protein TonB